MRKTLTALLIAASLPTLAMAATANDTPPPPPPGAPMMDAGPMMGGHGPRDHGGMKELNLTQEQRQKLGKLMGESMKNRHDINEKYLSKLSAADRKAMQDELKANHDKTQKDIRELLTPEQQKKFDELQKDRQARQAEWSEFQQWKAQKEGKGN